MHKRCDELAFVCIMNAAVAKLCRSVDRYDALAQRVGVVLCALQSKQPSQLTSYSARRKAARRGDVILETDSAAPSRTTSVDFDSDMGSVTSADVLPVRVNGKTPHPSAGGGKCALSCAIVQLLRWAASVELAAIFFCCTLAVFSEVLASVHLVSLPCMRTSCLSWNTACSLLGNFWCVCVVALSVTLHPSRCICLSYHRLFTHPTAAFAFLTTSSEGDDGDGIVPAAPLSLKTSAHSGAHKGRPETGMSTPFTPAAAMATPTLRKGAQAVLLLCGSEAEDAVSCHRFG